MRITANMVTMARIVLLPIPCAMLLHGEGVWLWIALWIYIALGITDFIDGYMARRDGPTKLGGLLDPVADKLFIASIILPLAGRGLCPYWVAGALFSRELLITALRSSVALREETIRTSRLAKMKTIVQMGGVGTVFLTDQFTVPVVLCMALALATPFGLGWLYFRTQRKDREPPFFLGPVTIGFLAWALLTRIPADTSILLQWLVIVGITWVSGLDYVLGAVGLFRRTGLRSADNARSFWGLVQGGLVPCLAGLHPAAVLPLLVALSAELGTAGIDNVVVAETRTGPTRPFLASGLGGLALLAFAVGAPSDQVTQWLPWAASALAIWSLAIALRYYAVHSELFRMPPNS